MTNLRQILHAIIVPWRITIHMLNYRRVLYTKKNIHDYMYIAAFFPHPTYYSNESNNDKKSRKRSPTLTYAQWILIIGRRVWQEPRCTLCSSPQKLQNQLGLCGYDLPDLTTYLSICSQKGYIKLFTERLGDAVLAGLPGAVHAKQSIPELSELLRAFSLRLCATEGIGTKNGKAGNFARQHKE